MTGSSQSKDGLVPNPTSTERAMDKQHRAHAQSLLLADRAAQWHLPPRARRQPKHGVGMSDVSTAVDARRDGWAQGRTLRADSGMSRWLLARPSADTREAGTYMWT